MAKAAKQVHRRAQRQDAGLLGLGHNNDVKALVLQAEAATAVYARLGGVDHEELRLADAVLHSEGHAAAVHRNVLVATNQE